MMKEKAQAYLKEHNELEKLYGTADGFLFERKQDATAHATTLGNKTVSEFTAEQTVVAKSETLTIDTELLEDRDFLMARYEALEGKKTPHNISTEKLAERVKELEVEHFETE